MTQHLQTLVNEHGRIRSMLLCFEAQLDRFGSAGCPDYDILEGSIAYCQEYLDRWHHPHEDALLKLLQVRAPDKARACAGLEAQHLSLARTLGELVKVFEAVERDAEYPREHLFKVGQTLLSDYREHLEWEEATFFPAVAAHLLPEDWQTIAARCAAATDPLTDTPIDHRYRALFGTIVDG